MKDPHHHRNAEWQLPEKLASWDQVNSALLMDIREAVKPLSRLDCYEFIEVPRTLRRIALLLDRLVAQGAAKKGARRARAGSNGSTSRARTGARRATRRSATT